MAEEDEGFAINSGEALRVAERLGRIKDKMNGMERAFKGTNTGSSKINRALEDFFKKSSEHRKKTGELLTSAANTLENVATGARRVDAGLAKGLEGKKEEQRGVRA